MTNTTGPLPALIAAAEKAPAGPWRAHGLEVTGEHVTCSVHATVVSGPIAYCYGGAPWTASAASAKARAEYIALANPATILRLARELQAARAVVAQARCPNGIEFDDWFSGLGLAVIAYDAAVAPDDEKEAQG